MTSFGSFGKRFFLFITSINLVTIGSWSSVAKSEYKPPSDDSSSILSIRISSAVTRSALRTTPLVSKKAWPKRSLIAFIVSCATRKSLNLLSCRTLTSWALPCVIAPFGLSARVRARVVPFGLTRKRTLAAAADPSTIARVSASRLWTSPRYSST